MDKKNFLVDIIEKPGAILINEYLDTFGKITVSMNLFKFDGTVSYPFFKDCPINNTRNEKEIADVLKNMILEKNVKILGIPRNENVIDLTSKKDIILVQKYLS